MTVLVNIALAFLIAALVAYLGGDLFWAAVAGFVVLVLGGFLDWSRRTHRVP